MLITWPRVVYVTNDDGDEQYVDVLGGGVVVPDCCENVRQFMTVALNYSYEDMSGAPAFKPSLSPPLPPDADWKLKIQLMLQEIEVEPIEGKTRFDVAVPTWTMRPAIDSNFMPVSLGPTKCPPVLFCPHCGTPMPEIERVPDAELPGPVHTPVGDGGYCGTCRERSMGCRCLFPTARWRVV